MSGLDFQRELARAGIATPITSSRATSTTVKAIKSPRRESRVSRPSSHPGMNTRCGQDQSDRSNSPGTAERSDGVHGLSLIAQFEWLTEQRVAVAHL
jgi:hypothetical protein